MLSLLKSFSNLNIYLFVSNTQLLPQSASLTAPSRGGLLFEVWRSLLVEGVVFYGVEF